jgi:hypothetical protein
MVIAHDSMKQHLRTIYLLEVHMTRGKRHRLMITGLLFMTLCMACQSDGILSNARDLKTSTDSAADAPWLQVQIFRPSTDSVEKLTVYSSGEVLLSNHPDYIEKRSTFDPERMQTFKKTVTYLLSQSDSLVPAEGMDRSAYYQVSYSYDQDMKLAPSSVGANKTLYDEIDKAIADVISDGLSIRLHISPSPQKEVSGYIIALEIENTRAEPLTLQFQPDQGVELLVYSDQQNTLQIPAWRFVFTPPLSNTQNSGMLRAGQPLRFGTIWDGKDIQGNTIKGDITIIGRLLSLPGGTPAAVKLSL